MMEDDIIGHVYAEAPLGKPQSLGFDSTSTYKHCLFHPPVVAALTRRHGVRNDSSQGFDGVCRAKPLLALRLMGSVGLVDLALPSLLSQTVFTVFQTALAALSDVSGNQLLP